jgi:coenzyme F420-reducing hydrogenase alpha subunit
MNDDPHRTIQLNVPMITRLEGEGALVLNADQGRLESVQLKIYEPPRFFEKFVEGKHYTELPHLVARICGICPIAYQMTAVRAVEKIFGLNLPPHIHALRRVTQCGEWLQSHILHIHFLAAPDYLGFPHMMAMARQHPEVVRRGLRLQALGNALLGLQGGRSVHPVGLKVGGFGAEPASGQIEQLLKKLEAGLVEAEQLVHWVAGLDLPEDQQDFLSVSCGGRESYPMNEGGVRVSDGTVIAPENFRQAFQEHQVSHSTALFSLYRNQHPYLVGPLARMNLNYDWLPGWTFPSDNMYHSIRARALECYFVMLEAMQILQNYQPGPAAMEVSPVAGWGAHVTEAPRGLIYHHYQMDEAGHVVSGCIVPPTSQNQARIEQDLIASVNRYGLDHSDGDLQAFCERLIRNYDPCISCSVHFLKLTVNRALA